MKRKGMNRDKPEKPAPRLYAFIARSFGLLRHGLKLGVIGGIGLLVPSATTSCSAAMYGMEPGWVRECYTDKDCADKCGTGWYCDVTECWFKIHDYGIDARPGRECKLYIYCTTDQYCLDICGPGWSCVGKVKNEVKWCSTDNTDLNPANCLALGGDRDSDSPDSEKQ